MSESLSEHQAKLAFLPSSSLYDVYKAGFISLRALKICRSAGVSTIAQLSNFFRKGNSFNNIPRCGAKTNTELIDIVKALDSTTFCDCFFNSLPTEVANIFKVSFKNISESLSPTSKPTILFFRLFPSVSHFVSWLLTDNDVTFDSISRESYDEDIVFDTASIIIKICSNIKTNIHSFSSELSDPSLQELTSEIFRRIESINNLFYKRFFKKSIERRLSPTKAKKLHRNYENLKRNSSTIVMNFANSNYPSFPDLIEVISLDLDSFVKKFGNKKKSSHGFYHNILIPFARILEETLKSKEDETSKALVEFPFLTDDAVKFVADFHENSGYYPLFHIIYNYLIHNSSRNARMFCLKHGIGPDKKRHSLDEIGIIHNLTRERARQITQSPQFLHDIDIYVKRDELLHPYSLPGALICFSSSKWYIELINKEQLPDSFNLFAEIYCNYFDYHHVEKKHKPYIAAKSHLDQISSIVDSVVAIYHEKRTKDVLYEIPVPRNHDQKLLRSLALDIIAPSLGIATTGDKLMFPKNVYDIESEATVILEKNGQPMHIDSIIYQLRSNNPAIAIKDATIKYILQHSDRITSMGKSSKYALRAWKHIYTGSIRDAIRKTLSESNVPLHIKSITHSILEICPSTNEKNINSNLWQSPEFCIYNQTLFGLADKIYPPEFKKTDAKSSKGSFDERFNQFKEFINKYQRLPYQGPGIEGAFLARWKDNVLRGSINVTDHQVRSLKKLIRQNSHLPQNGREHIFLQNCKAYLHFVKTNNTLPSYRSDMNLYQWMIKARSRHKHYSDNRTAYFFQLIAELQNIFPSSKTLFSNKN